MLNYENYLNIIKEGNDGNFKSITSPLAVYNMYLEKNIINEDIIRYQIIEYDEKIIDNLFIISL